MCLRYEKHRSIEKHGVISVALQRGTLSIFGISFLARTGAPRGSGCGD